jgi:hypothetical protein
MRISFDVDAEKVPREARCQEAASVAYLLGEPL